MTPGWKSAVGVAVLDGALLTGMAASAMAEVRGLFDQRATACCTGLLVLFLVLMAASRVAGETLADPLTAASAGQWSISQVDDSNGLRSSSIPATTARRRPIILCR